MLQQMSRLLLNVGCSAQNFLARLFCPKKYTRERMQLPRAGPSHQTKFLVPKFTSPVFSTSFQFRTPDTWVYVCLDICSYEQSLENEGYLAAWLQSAPLWYLYPLLGCSVKHVPCLAPRWKPEKSCGSHVHWEYISFPLYYNSGSLGPQKPNPNLPWICPNTWDS